MFSSRHKIVAPRIVQPGAGSRKWWIILLLVLVAVWSWFVFDFGRQRAGLHVDVYDSRVAELEKQMEQQAKKIEQLRLESASHQRSAQIDKNAAMQAQHSLKEFQQEKAELKREVDFLNGLLSDKAKKAVLRLERLLITEVSESNSFNLRFTLVHLTKVGGSAKGNVSVMVEGSLAGKNKKLGLAEMASDKKSSMKMGFKNFQKFEEMLTLPEGFEPTSITISAEIDGKNIEDFEQTKPWSIDSV